jgi:hypothetical protein
MAEHLATGTLGRMYDDYLASLGQADSNTAAPEPEFVPPPTMSLMDSSRALILKILKIQCLLKKYGL